MRAISCILAMWVMIAVIVGPAQGENKRLITRVTIYDTRYAVVDAQDVLSKVPSSMVQTIVAISRYCSTAKAYGYYTSGEVGVVAWAPRSFFDCLDTDNNGQVVGGGPGGLCGLYYKGPRYYVAVFAATSRLCARLTSEAPGGYPASANRAFTMRDGTQIAQGQHLLITCQRYDAGGLEDYVLLTAGPIPGDRQPYWVLDDWVDTGGQSRLPSLPLC